MLLALACQSILGIKRQLFTDACLAVPFNRTGFRAQRSRVAMARRVFFSFHYDRDVRRVVQVRNSWIVRSEGEAQPFVDKAVWESVKKRGIEKWIEEQLADTSVTVVIIGAETYDREWVRH